ncbi:MAG: tryptophan-rich sensory protein [Mycolicibacterium sp.]|uniref:tryptophan-rich sensory protein n=1 Tax=Mycolicibacterium sp. TaxID=2320850 RepID=UPI003D0BEC68
MSAAAVGRRPVSALVALTYLAMVVMNVLANALPLNGRRTGEVSQEYQNLFTPAGLTFSIWSVIYLLLGIHVLYQLGFFHGRQPGSERTALLNRIGLLFATSSVANTAWVFAWHYGLIPLSAVLIVVILVCLILIANAVRVADLSARERWFVGVPFSVYFGWTTVATVANVTVLLVYLNWDGFGWSEATWAVIVVLVAMAIGTVTTLRNRDLAYGLVLIWAFVGILIRQTSSDGLDGRYPVVIATVVVSLLVFVAAEIVLLRLRRSAVTDSKC